MSHSPHGGIYQLKGSIWIQAPVELCYQEWSKLSEFPSFMRRVIKMHPDMQQDVEELPLGAPVLNSTSQTEPSVLFNDWLLAGPGGNLYHIKNRTVHEIPNSFYCMSSVDIEDLATQFSVLFAFDDIEQATFMELEISFWETEQVTKGKSTQILSDIFNSNDTFVRDCLEDFKRHMESLPTLPQ